MGALHAVVLVDVHGVTLDAVLSLLAGVASQGLGRAIPNALGSLGGESSTLEHIVFVFRRKMNTNE